MTEKMLPTMDTAMREVAAAAYAANAPLIEKTVRGFCNRHGGHYPDLLADANTAFLRGHMDLEARPELLEKVPYEVHIRRWVWFELFDEYRKQRERQNTLAPARGVDVEECAGPDSNFSLDEFCGDLGADAALCVRLATDPPEPLRSIIIGKGGEERNVRSTIREHLLRTCGWSRPRINAAFEEVRQNLT